MTSEIPTKQARIEAKRRKIEDLLQEIQKLEDN